LKKWDARIGLISLRVLGSFPIVRTRRLRQRIPKIGASVLIRGRAKKRNMSKIFSIAAELCILAGVCAIGGMLMVASPAIYVAELRLRY
jgi:hypothetical protein